MLKVYIKEGPRALLTSLVYLGGKFFTKRKPSSFVYDVL